LVKWKGRTNWALEKGQRGGRKRAGGGGGLLNLNFTFKLAPKRGGQQVEENTEKWVPSKKRG